MKTRIISTFTLTAASALLLLTLFSVASASPPTYVSGRWIALTAPTPTFSDFKYVGANVFFIMANSGQYDQGPITGTFTQTVQYANHFSDPTTVETLTPEKPSTWPKTDFSMKIERTFTGQYDGKTGTLIMRLESKGFGRVRSIDYMDGTWVIIGGTDGLANLHGQGTWWSTSSGINEYEGELHFSPSNP